MKVQTGLQKLSKQFFKELALHVPHDKDSFEKFYKEVEDKWFNIENFNSESAVGHPDTKTWRQLYWCTCQEIVRIRKIYKEIYG